MLLPLPCVMDVLIFIGGEHEAEKSCLLAIGLVSTTVSVHPSKGRVGHARPHLPASSLLAPSSCSWV